MRERLVVSPQQENILACLSMCIHSFHNTAEDEHGYVFLEVSGGCTQDLPIISTFVCLY